MELDSFVYTIHCFLFVRLPRGDTGDWRDGTTRHCFAITLMILTLHATHKQHLSRSCSLSLRYPQISLLCIKFTRLYI